MFAGTSESRHWPPFHNSPELGRAESMNIQGMLKLTGKVKVLAASLGVVLAAAGAYGNQLGRRLDRRFVR